MNLYCELKLLGKVYLMDNQQSLQVSMRDSKDMG